MSIESKAERLSDYTAVHYGSDLVWGTVVGGSGRLHHCAIWLDGRQVCDCRGYHYHDDCSHLRALAHATPSGTRERLIEALNTDQIMPRQKNDLMIRTGIEPFNEMMSPTGDSGHPMAGIPRGSGIGLSGRPQAGKTTLSFQLAHEVMAKSGEGSNALMFDTEGSIYTYQMWQETFSSRYGLDTTIVDVEPIIVDGEVQGFNAQRDPDADHQIFVMDVRDLSKILTIHGRPGKISTEDSKMKLVPDGPHEEDISDTGIGHFVIQNDVDYIAYDSITNPIEHFTNRQQDRPTRAKATAWWMLQAQALAEETNMVQVYITHLSKNPTNPYDRPDVLGGKNVKHQMKFMIYMRESEDTERAMRLFRHPGKKPWDQEWYMDLQTGKGFVPADG